MSSRSPPTQPYNLTVLRHLINACDYKITIVYYYVLGVCKIMIFDCKIVQSDNAIRLPRDGLTTASNPIPLQDYTIIILHDRI